MHELFLIKVPETLDTKAFMHPVTIMTRSPIAAIKNFYILFSLNSLKKEKSSRN